MTGRQKFDEILHCNNFGVDFKNLIKLALAIWGKIKLAQSNQISKVLKRNFLERKQIMPALLVSMDNKSERLGYPKKDNYGGSINSYTVFWGATKSLGGVLPNNMKSVNNIIFLRFWFILLISSKICSPYFTWEIL